ncbi:hypothetical protein PBY51_023600 [Eleginops maclovinus]|uniref:Uncharacterized protein n=1 Tax=Eleginops maclovinus TaxID=56733 RepID=A0AAN8A3B9_ELEMC|nr:hypothetical protein PBY51_023600 [Eleginops maclovinus]
MGQKLEKLSEKDEESLDSSDWSGQTEETEHSETARPDESRDLDDGSFVTPLGIGGISRLSVSSPATGHEGDLTVTSARTDPQTGQPIRPQGQQQHPLNTRGEKVGGDKESRSVTRTAEKSKTVLSPKETSKTLNKIQDWRSKLVVPTGTTAMEEHGNVKKSELGHRKLCSDTRTASCDSTNEEDFVVLDNDGTWMTSDGKHTLASGKRQIQGLFIKKELRKTLLHLTITFHDLPGMPVKKKVMRRKAGEDLTPFHS